MQVARVAVRVVRRLTEHAHLAALFHPAQDAIVGDVAPQQIAAVAEPHRPLGPAAAGVETLDRGVADSIARETWIDDLDARIRIADDRIVTTAAHSCRAGRGGRDCNRSSFRAGARRAARSRCGLLRGACRRAHHFRRYRPGRRGGGDPQERSTIHGVLLRVRGILGEPFSAGRRQAFERAKIAADPCRSGSSLSPRASSSPASPPRVSPRPPLRRRRSIAVTGSSTSTARAATASAAAAAKGPRSRGRSCAMPPTTPRW